MRELPDYETIIELAKKSDAYCSLSSQKERGALLLGIKVAYQTIEVEYIANGECKYLMPVNLLKEIKDDIGSMIVPKVVYSSSHLVMLKNAVEVLINKAKEISEKIERFMNPH